MARPHYHKVYQMPRAVQILPCSTSHTQLRGMLIGLQTCLNTSLKLVKSLLLCILTWSELTSGASQQKRLCNQWAGNFLKGM